MAELSPLQAVPGGAIGSGLAQVYSPNATINILANAQQRQMAMEQLRAQKEARLAAQAAKKAEEDYIAEFKAAEGGLFQPLVNEYAMKMREQALRNSQGQPQAVQKREVKDADFKVALAGNWGKAQGDRIKAIQTEKAKRWNVSASELDKIGKQVFAQDPDAFFTKDIAGVYEQEITSNPENYKWAQVGEELIKPVGENEFSFRNAAGQETKVKTNDLFITKKVKDKATGTERLVPEKINMKRAKEIVAGDLETRAVIERYIENREAQGIPEDQAREEAYNRLFQRFGGVSLEQDKTTEKGRAAARVAGERMANTMETPGPVEVVTDFRDSSGNVQGEAVKVNLGTGYYRRTPKPVTLPANTQVYVLGGESGDADKFLKKNPDGTYRTNLSMNTEEYVYVPTDVYFTKEPVEFTKKKDGQVYERAAGQLIHPTELAGIQKSGQMGKLTKTSGVRLVPNKYQFAQDMKSGEESLRNPTTGTIDLFVPYTQAQTLLAPFGKGTNQPNKPTFRGF